MSTAVEFVPVNDVGVAAFGPTPRGAIDLLGKYRDSGGDLDFVESPTAKALPVHPRGGSTATGQPIEHHVVQDPVVTKNTDRDAIGVGPVPELLEDPGALADRRVHQRIADCLGTS